MKDETLQALAARFPEDAIERTKKADTQKGYDTAGIKYAYIVERLNEQLGLGWTYDDEIIECAQGKWRSGAACFDVTMKVAVSIKDGRNVVCRHAYGGHRASAKADAFKGALTNGLKKAAAMFGVGLDTYKGILDDDNLSQPDAQPARRQGQQSQRQAKKTGGKKGGTQRKDQGPKGVRYQQDQQERALLRKSGHNVPAQPKPKTAQEADTLHEDHLTQCVWKVHDRHKQGSREIAYFWSEPEMDKQDVLDWLHEGGHIGELGGDAKQVGEEVLGMKERMRWQVVKNLD
ncbi:MAG: Rad52/Rad22 family DNA repair protein [Myxococcota bacterium]